MEQKMLDLMKSEFSWEQVVFQVIAHEGLDPWDVDIKALSDAFVDYLMKLEEMDFKIPAKYVIIAAVLLRMKSDHLKYLGDLVQDAMPFEEMDVDMRESGGTEEIEGMVPEAPVGPDLLINAITIPPKRQPRRKIMVDDLMGALRRALRAEDRRERRLRRNREKIQIKDDNITSRIAMLYNRINDIMGRMKKDEVKFSGLVNRWERHEVVDTFIPLVFLDNQRKVDCQQEEMFREIMIKKGESELTEEDIKELEKELSGKHVKRQPEKAGAKAVKGKAKKAARAKKK
jgi:segregation and condensation protein A